MQNLKRKRVVGAASAAGFNSISKQMPFLVYGRMPNDWAAASRLFSSDDDLPGTREIHCVRFSCNLLRIIMWICSLKLPQSDHGERNRWTSFIDIFPHACVKWNCTFQHILPEFVARKKWLSLSTRKHSIRRVPSDVDDDEPKAVTRKWIKF